MDAGLPLPELANHIQALDRDACIAELHRVPHLRLDFTDAYLNELTVDAVRHLLMAACLQARKHGNAA